MDTLEEDVTVIRRATPKEASPRRGGCQPGSLRGRDLAVLRDASGVLTIAHMKDTMLTIRLPAATRRRIEQHAKRESRSLSQVAEQLIERGLAAGLGGAHVTGEARQGWDPSGAVPLAGSLAGGLVPTLDDFRAARGAISAALNRRSRPEPASGSPKVARTARSAQPGGARAKPRR